MVRLTSLTLAIIGTMGLAAVPTSAFSIAPAGSEAALALVTGAVLLTFAMAARRLGPARKD